MVFAGNVLRPVCLRMRAIVVVPGNIALFYIIRHSTLARIPITNIDLDQTSPWDYRYNAFERAKA
jgi:hypothetical protein